MQGQVADVDRAHDRFIAFVVYNTKLEHIAFDRARRICRKREIEISQRCTFARKSRRAVTDFRIFPKRLLFKPKCTLSPFDNNVKGFLYHFLPSYFCYNFITFWKFLYEQIRRRNVFFP